MLIIDYETEMRMYKRLRVNVSKDSNKKKVKEYENILQKTI